MWLEQINPCIHEMWRGDWRPGFVEPARYLYDHELICVMAGEFTLTAAGQSYELRAGQFIIAPPNTHHLSEASQGAVTRVCIHFDWLPQPTEKREGLFCYHPQRPKESQVCQPPKEAPISLEIRSFSLGGDIPRLLDQFFNRWSAGGASAGALCRGLFLELLTQLFTPLDRGAAAHPNRSAQLAYSVKDLLDQRDLRADESIQEVMESLGFSYAHLARLFQKAFGQSPLAYVNTRKLERARLLLDDPRISVKEAADVVGYQDVSYFIRSFRRQFGRTPAQYRDGG